MNCVVGELKEQVMDFFRQSVIAEETASLFQMQMRICN